MMKNFIRYVGFFFLSIMILSGTDKVCVQAHEVYGYDDLQDPEYDKYNKVLPENNKKGVINTFDKQLFGGASSSVGVLGCDVSKWQGNIDWNKAKNAGINFAFIRVGYRGKENGQLYNDNYFVQNIQGALKAGIKVGVYLFSEAINTSEAIEEADFIVSKVAGYDVSLPLVIDYEGFDSTHRVYNAHLNSSQMTAIVAAFGDRVSAYGYRSAIYGSASYFEPRNNGDVYYMDGPQLCKKYSIWTAAYSAAPSLWNKKTVYDYWQFTNKANGYNYGMSSESLDLDYAYNWNGLCKMGNGSVSYYSNGKFNSSHTGVDIYFGEWYRVRNGLIDYSFTGLAPNSNGWWYIKSGKVDFCYNGIVNNQNGDWYVKNGKVQFGISSVVKPYADNDDWYYVKEGQVQYGQETVQENSNGWWYIGTNGKVDFTKETVAHNENGWWKIENGKVNFDFTGIAHNDNGDWYCKNGKVQFVTSVIKPYADKDNWYYIRNGKVQYGQETVQKNNNGWWYIGNDGKVDFTKETVAHNENGWWKIENGKVNFNFIGIAHNNNGDWYCKNGKVQFGMTSVIRPSVDKEDWYYVKCGQVQYGQETVRKNNNGWWYIGTDGKVNFTKETVAHNENGWWKIENGKVNFSFNGIGHNQYGDWYIKSGKVDFKYNGNLIWNNKIYNIINGKVA